MYSTLKITRQYFPKATGCHNVKNKRWR